MAHKTACLELEGRVLEYFAALDRSLFDSNTVNELRAALSRDYTEVAIGEVLDEYFKQDAQGKPVLCANWEDDEQQAHYMYDVNARRIIGVLVPADESLRA